MTTQQIIISPTGEVTSLEFKRGKGLDIRTLGGDAEIKRSSLIEFVPELQKNVVILMQAQPFLEAHQEFMVNGIHSKDVDAFGLLVEQNLTMLAEVEHSGDWAPDSSVYYGAAVFADYEDAVAFEVKIIQGLRRKFGQGAV